MNNEKFYRMMKRATIDDHLINAARNILNKRYTIWEGCYGFGSMIIDTNPGGDFNPCRQYGRNTSAIIGYGDTREGATIDLARKVISASRHWGEEYQ